jgi:hypothetical protein
MLNWELIKNPFNWFIIVLMVVIAAIAGHQLVKLVSNHASGSAQQ